MSISESSLSYEIPCNFQYVTRKQTVDEKICGIVKKIIAFLNRNQFAVTVSFFSFLISKTIASSLEDPSGELAIVDELQDCQERICAYWNNTMQNYELTNQSTNLLSRLSSRCDPSHSHYKPFKSVKRCMKTWCKHANREGNILPECVDPLQKLVEAWNKFCSKAEFNRLRRTRKVAYMNHCLRRLCDYLKENKEKSTFHFFCTSVEVHHSIEKLYDLLKDWKEQQNTQEDPNKNLESTLSITSSAVGIISAGISVVATLIGCCVAKITLSSFPDVSIGLKNIVDATLLYARQATATPPDSLAVAEIARRVSQISSHLGVYQEAASSGSSIDNTNLHELHFDFGYQEISVAEESSLSGSSLEQRIKEEDTDDTKRFLESSIFSQGIAQKFIEMTKNSTKFINPQNRSVFENITELYQTMGEATEEIVGNFTRFLIENATKSIDPSKDPIFLDNTTLTSNLTHSLFNSTQDYTVSSSSTTTEKPLWKLFLEFYVKQDG